MKEIDSKALNFEHKPSWSSPSLFTQLGWNSSVPLSADFVLTISINYIHTVTWQNKSKGSRGNGSIHMTFCNLQVFTCLHLASQIILLAHSRLQSPTTNSPEITYMRYSLFDDFFLTCYTNLLHPAHRPPVEQPCMMSYFNKTIYSRVVLGTSCSACFCFSCSLAKRFNQIAFWQNKTIQSMASSI